jgi:phospholipid/cholesterol/gamma-HCH transport system substrate-binding protein
VVVVRGVAVTVALLAIIYLGASLYNGVPTTHYGTAYVSVPIVGDLLAHDAVRIAGVRVGQVEAIGLGRDEQPRLQLQLDPGTHLQVGTQVMIRANGLLGARYVQLIPGSSHRLLPSGATIRGGAGSFTNGLPEVIATFDAATRHGFTRSIDGLSTGLAGEGGRLNESIHQLSIGTPEFDAIARAVLAHDFAAKRLIPSLDSAMTPLAGNRQYVQPGFTALTPAVTPFSSERAAVQATLAAAPTTLATAQNGLERGLQLLSSVRSLATAASTTLPPAPRALADLSALLGAAPVPLRELVPDLQHRLPVTAAGLERLLAGARGKLVPLLDEGVSLARPQLQYIGEHSCDFKNFAASMRSMTGFGQPGDGPVGQAMAFRLTLTVPAGGEGLGLNASGPLGLGLYKRVGHDAPCAYLSRPYPLLNSNPLGLARRPGAQPR